MVTVISEFRGEYSFLSNYDVNAFSWRGIQFKSAEHAFAYAKTSHIKNGWDSLPQLRKQILESKTPNEAKGFGRRLPLDVEEWEKRKVHYMREIVHAKFGQVKDYAGKLIGTGYSPLVEGNTWNDGFWGNYRNDDGVIVGLNMLGTILMEERGYWLWYGQANSDVLGSVPTPDQRERTADYA